MYNKKIKHPRKRAYVLIFEEEGGGGGKEPPASKTSAYAHFRGRREVALMWMWGVSKHHPSNLWVVKSLLASTDYSNFEGKRTLFGAHPSPHPPVLYVVVIMAVAGEGQNPKTRMNARFRGPRPSTFQLLAQCIRFPLSSQRWPQEAGEIPASSWGINAPIQLVKVKCRHCEKAAVNSPSPLRDQLSNLVGKSIKMP